MHNLASQYSNSYYFLIASAIGMSWGAGLISGSRDLSVVEMENLKDFWIFPASLNQCSLYTQCFSSVLPTVQNPSLHAASKGKSLHRYKIKVKHCISSLFPTHFQFPTPSLLTLILLLSILYHILKKKIFIKAEWCFMCWFFILHCSGSQVIIYNFYKIRKFFFL